MPDVVSWLATVLLGAILAIVSATLLVRAPGGGRAKRLVNGPARLVAPVTSPDRGGGPRAGVGSGAGADRSSAGWGPSSRAPWWPRRRLGAGVAADWRLRITALTGRRRKPDVVALLGALAAEIDAGQPLEHALEHASHGLDPDPCPRARAASRVGSDVARALRADAEAAGSRGLRGLAACWEVSGRSGAGLATAVRQLAEAQRASAEARADLVGEVAAVRASARILAGLPGLGLALGTLIGAAPLTWLTGAPAGRAVLLAGMLLQGAGLLWLRRIVARAARGIP